MKTPKKFGMLAMLLALTPLTAFAATDTGDTAWMILATALVMIMTPGLAFFYAGMVRTKNSVSTIYQNIVALAVIGLLWAVVGFSLAFSGGNGFIGDLKFLFLEGVGQEPDGTSTIPFILFMMFQMMFAIITPALMTGAFAERVKFKAWIIIMVLWSLVVYSPVAHWVWSPSGWLFTKGALDFAGGLVVHMTAGFSALVAAIMVGKRKDFGQPHSPYNIAIIVIGTTLLWFGWFGFNAGSALAANGLAAQAFATTFLASAAALVAWVAVDVVKDGKPTVVGACVGVVAGLVTITPAAGFVTVGASMIIGLLAGFVCNVVSRLMKSAFKLDDTLDAFGCHGIGGLLGAILTGVFATKTVNPAGNDGLLYGNNSVLIANLTGAAAVAVYSMVATYVIIKIVGFFTKIRVTEDEEKAGLDESQHGEKMFGHL